MFERVTREVISGWMDRGIEQGATHMLVISDTFSYEYSSRYVRKSEDPRTVEQEYDAQSMSSVAEIYNLSLPKDPQLDETRARHS
jgi:hypothetical protein